MAAGIHGGATSKLADTCRLTNCLVVFHYQLSVWARKVISKVGKVGTYLRVAGDFWFACNLT